jgi:hypothetical protein
MANPAIIGLGHLDFTVTDGDRAMQWWQEVMGFKLLAEWEHAGFRAWTMATPAVLPRRGVSFLVCTACLESSIYASSETVSVRRRSWAMHG